MRIISNKLTTCIAAALLLLSLGAEAQPGRMRSSISLARELLMFNELDKQSDVAPVSASQYARAANTCMAMHYYRDALRFKEKALAIDSMQCDSDYVEILRCNGRYIDAARICYQLHQPIPPQLSFAIAHGNANPQLTVYLQRSVTAPGFIYGLSVNGSSLQYAATGSPVDPFSQNLTTQQLGASPLLYSTSYGDGSLGYPDVDMSTDNCSYKVMHPQGRMYYTIQDGSGKGWLYKQRVIPGHSAFADKFLAKKGDQVRIKKVKFQGFTMNVEHPVFSRDGRIMIFSSDYSGGYGGYDLWYSELNGGRWSMPKNLGRNINTPQDEISPSLFGDYLLFASNGQKDNYGGYDLYSTRLMDWNYNSDTVGAIALGHSPVQNLFAPINSPYDDMELVIAPDSASGYWVSYRDSASYSAKVYGFCGKLSSTMLRGVVYDAFGAAVPEVKVTLLQGHRELYTVNGGLGGNYHIFLQPGQTYQVRFEKPDFFNHTITVTTNHKDEHDLIVPITRDIKLSGYNIGETYGYMDVFEPNAGIEITDEGRQQLADFARFAKENQHLVIDIMVLCRLTDDTKFNAMINKHRINNLRNYLANSGVPRSNVRIVSIGDLPQNYHLHLHENVKSAVWITFQNKK